MILAVSLIACILISLLISVVTGYFIRSASLKNGRSSPGSAARERCSGFLHFFFHSERGTDVFREGKSDGSRHCRHCPDRALLSVSGLPVFPCFCGCFDPDCTLHAQRLLCRGLEILIFFAFMCFVVGTIGIFISAKPHWMRDWIRKIAASTKWRIVSTAVPLLFAIASLILVIQLKGVL